jgi:hypothetical protein
MFISIHIPKTGGTTLGYIFDYGMRRRIFYDYSVARGPLFREERALLGHHKPFLTARFDIIHGHFPYRKYADLFPDAFFVTCLRDPLARTLSNYRHLLEEGDPSHFLYADIQSGAMGLSEYAELPQVRRAQTQYLEGRPIDAFHHLGLTERLAESIYHFQVLFNFDRNDPYMNLEGEASVPNTNPGSARHAIAPKFDKATLDKTRSLLEEDYDLYARATALFAQQAREVDAIREGRRPPVFDVRAMIHGRITRERGPIVPPGATAKP